MGYRDVGLLLVLAFSAFGVDSEPNRADDIVRTSVQNINRDWQAAPQYDFTEHDIITKNGTRTDKTYQVMMIEGSTYNKLIAVNGKPLSPEQAAQEDRRAKEEIDRRRKEPPSERQKRIAKYQNERHQDHELMTEMAKAFDFKLAGQDTVNGHRCLALTAEPKPGYRPPDRDAEVLKGMRGTMWVDAQQYQWVKVHAELFRPVSFGLFFARVRPGTEFTFEQEPVQGDLWLPSHFQMVLNARVFIASRHSRDDETYSNYHRAQ